MKTFSTLLAASLTLFCFVGHGFADDKKLETLRVPDAAGLQVRRTPLSEMDLLKARVDDLEQEIASLKQNGVGARTATTPVKRVPRDGKNDLVGSTQDEFNKLWNQITLIMDKLDELSAKR